MNIMLIEDDMVFSLLMKNQIEKLGYDYTFGHYTRSERALGKLKSLKPDIILIDHHLEGVNGIETIPLFRELCPHARIVVVSSSEGINNYITAFENGADMYFKKDNDVFKKTRDYIQTLIEEKQVPKSRLNKLKAFFGFETRGDKLNFA